MAIQPRHVKITSPCPAKLDPDRGKDGAKSWYCGHCEKNVHVLSNMTEPEARSLLADKVGQDLCVSYVVRPDGSIRFKAPPPAPIVPLSSLRRRTAVAAAAVGMSAALAACTPHAADDDRAPMVSVETAEPTASERPTIPLARRLPRVPSQTVRVEPEPPPEPPPEPEIMVDGGIGMEPIELPDPEPIEGGLKAMPVPEPGGLTVEPLPPEEEPCDTAASESIPKPGGLRVAPLPPAK